MSNGSSLSMHAAAKHLDPDEAEAIDRLAGGLPPQRLPSRSPRAGEEVWSWFGGLNLDLEKTFELAVYGSKRLWKRIGFPTAPLLQQRLPATKTSDRIMIPDLLAPGVVGEVKRSIGPNNGPAQIEGYLERLEQTRTDQGPWSGRLIHAEKHVSPALRHRLERSGAPIEVWSVERQGRRWKARQQYPD